MSSSSPSGRALSGIAGRTAIVTGSARGIGLGVAQALARAGAKVGVFDLDREVAAAASDAINQECGDGSALAVGLDLTSADEVEAGVADVLASFGSVDILVNNAGVITGPTNVDDLSEDDWDWVVGVNTKSQFLMARSTIPHMKKEGYGRIINVASRSWLGVAGRVHYAASKGAVVSLHPEPCDRAWGTWNHGELHLSDPGDNTAVQGDSDSRSGKTFCCGSAVNQSLGQARPTTLRIVYCSMRTRLLPISQANTIYVGGGADLMTGTP